MLLIVDPLRLTPLQWILLLHSNTVYVKTLMT